MPVDRHVSVLAPIWISGWMLYVSARKARWEVLRNRCCFLVMGPPTHGKNLVIVKRKHLEQASCPPR